MKTTLLNVPGAWVSSVFPIAIAVFAMIPVSAFGQFDGNDPLSKKSANWSASNSPGTSLVFQHQRLETLIKSPAKNNYSFLTWTPNSGGYGENWYFQVNVHLDPPNLPSNSGVVMGIGAMSFADPSHICYVGIADERYNGFKSGMFLVTECLQPEPHHRVETTATDATLRLHFDQASKTLTGSWNAGSGWKYAPPLRIKDWGMGGGDEFGALLMAGNFGDNSKELNVRSGSAHFTNFVAGAARPDITVEQPGGSSLTDGKSTKRFGSVSVHSQGRSKTFTIRNEGTAKLRNLTITRDGSHAADFIVTQPAATLLKPGASTTFMVTFKPKATGTRSAAIHITSNDPDESPFDISLSGVGVK